MEYRLLGPLEARENDESIPLGGAKQRALLAVLLLRANQVVARDRLVDELWGDAPPKTAQETVQVYVSRLRKLLGNDRIETRAQGYVLHAAPDELDIGRLEQLLAAARAAVEPARRADLARQALGLFDGDPLADFRTEAFAQAEIGRLQQLRLEALEERIDADLELGRAPDVIAELEALARAEPQRERVYELLMLALYRAGRQADALDVYRDLRRTMVGELGLEPGPTLRSLERAILAHDPALEPRHAQLRLPRRRLPSPPHALVGRVAELQAVESLLHSGARLVTITGPGGSGKTRVALAVAERLDSAVFVPLAPLGDHALVASTIAGALEITEVPGRSVEETIAERIGDTRLLLVLDNAEHVLDGTLFLARLLERCPRLTLLVTSRAPLHLAAEHDYPLDPLPPTDAATLFRARARAINAKFAATDETVARICERLDHLPLALELAAVHTKVLSSSDLLARLDDRFELLAAGPRDAPDRQRTLRRTIDWSYVQLSDDERQLFARLAVFAGGCTAEAVEVVCDASLDALRSLVDVSLVQAGLSRFSMLESIHAFAAEQLAQVDPESTVRRQHAQFFLELAERCASAFEGPGLANALRMLDDEIDNLRAALSWSYEFEPSWTLRLAAALGRFWAARGLYREARIWLDAVTPLAELDPAAGIRALMAGANFAGHGGDRERARALCERGLTLARGIGASVYVAKLLTTLGTFDRIDGDAARARARLTEALAIEAADDLGMEAVARATLAYVSIDAGDFVDAAEQLSSSAMLLRAMNDGSRLATVLAGLAYVRTELEEHVDAASALHEALHLAADFDDPSLAGEVLLVAAYAERARDPLRAAQWLGFAESVYARIGREWEPTDTHVREATLADLRRALEEPALADARAAGGRLTVEGAIALTAALSD